MTVTTNTTDRKALAKALADELGTTAKYMGPPTFGYQVGDYIVDRDGNIEGTDFEALRDFLQRNGCFPEEETEPAGEQTEPESESIENPDQVSIMVPADDLTPEGMIDFLGLRNVDYNYTSTLGHFWRQWLPWEDKSRPYGK